MTTDTDCWSTWHLLHSDETTNGCKNHCGDPLCKVSGCLDKKALDKRSIIMAGVSKSRRIDPKSYPMIVPNTQGIECDIKVKCIDPICQITGCLEKKAWTMRPLIEIGLEQEIEK